MQEINQLLGALEGGLVLPLAYMLRPVKLTHEKISGYLDLKLLTALMILLFLLCRIINLYFWILIDLSHFVSMNKYLAPCIGGVSNIIRLLIRIHHVNVINIIKYRCVQTYNYLFYLKVETHWFSPDTNCCMSTLEIFIDRQPSWNEQGRQLP